MKPFPHTRIAGTGSHLPPRRVSNDELVASLAERGLESS
ncbi:MAG: 3-oxoacyl-ACP synthase, partial [Rubrivivax sp.]|nr:3-oxoacyl-ACP synthase [Rubrivivax sp.]